MKVYESGIVYKKTYEGMTEEGFRATFVITYITLEIKQGLFGIKRKFKIKFYSYTRTYKRMYVYKGFKSYVYWRYFIFWFMGKN